MVVGARKGRFVLVGRSISEQQRIRYLLGLASPAEREQIESEYFEDEDAFQEMLTAENDLFDAYVRGELSREERQKFEKSFVSSLHGRDRVQFARAFADAVSATRSLQIKLPSKLPGIFKTFQSLGLLRTATIAAMIVFVAGVAWLMIDRRRMTNELRELRSHSAELGKRTEELQRSGETERTRPGEIATQLADLRPRRDRPRRLEPTTATQRPPFRPAVKNDNERIASGKPEPAELIRTPDTSLGSNLVPKKIIASDEAEQAEKLVDIQDASLGSSFTNKKITQLPLEARNVPNLLTLQTAATRDGYVAGARVDQTEITLDGVSEPPNTFFLSPRNTSTSGDPTIRIPNSPNWIRFQLALETPAIYEDYRIIIRTVDGRPVTSVDWIEPLTPNQTIIDTPIVSTSDLRSGDYVLLLLGKERDGSFVKLAEYSFKAIKE